MIHDLNLSNSIKSAYQLTSELSSAGLACPEHRPRLALGVFKACPQNQAQLDSDWSNEPAGGTARVNRPASLVLRLEARYYKNLSHCFYHNKLNSSCKSYTFLFSLKIINTSNKQNASPNKLPMKVHQDQLGNISCNC